MAQTFALNHQFEHPFGELPLQNLDVSQQVEGHRMEGALGIEGAVGAQGVEVKMSVRSGRRGR